MSPTKKLELQTPFEFFHGYKPEISHLRIFGSRDFAYIPKDDIRKSDAKSIECIFVGYHDDQKAYKLFNPSSHKLIASRDVVFHENTDICNKMNNVDEEQILDEDGKIDKIIQKVQEQQQVEEQESNMSDTTSDDETTEDRRIMDGTPTGIVIPRRSTVKLILQ